MYGDTCFKCHGKGYTLTARGAAAQEKYTASLCIPATEVKPGDKVWYRDGVIATSRWITVTEVSEPKVISRSQTGGADAPWIDHIGIRIDGTDAKGSRFSITELLGGDVRIAREAEFKQAKLAEALAYQETLTKKGTPRKASRKQETASA